MMVMPDAPMLALDAEVELRLLKILVQLAVIISIAGVGAMLARRIGQPGVVGQIAAGLALGPSLLGGLSTSLATGTELTGGVDLLAALFDPDLQRFFFVFAQLGLVLLVFHIGLEFDFTHLRDGGGTAAGIALAGLAVPFVLGVLIAPVLAPAMGVNQYGKVPDALGWSLFLGTALSITALPVLGRMLVELNIHRTRLGAITISAAAIGDGVGWVLLAVVAGVARARSESGEYDPLEAAKMAGLAMAFAVAVFFVVGPWLGRRMEWSLKRNGGVLGAEALAGLLVVLLLCAALTSHIGIFAILGAFVLGASLSSHTAVAEAVNGSVGAFATALFLPVFFTYTGLRTDIGSLGTAELWWLCALVLAAAFAGKMGACTAAARLGGFGPRHAVAVGVMMNARGLMELVVINEGYEIGVVTRAGFCILVIMALATTFATTPLLVRTLRGTELRPLLARAGFLPVLPDVESAPTPQAAPTVSTTAAADPASAPGAVIGSGTGGGSGPETGPGGK